MAQLLEIRGTRRKSEMVFIDLHIQEPIMALAKKAKANIFLRVEDYYADEHFTVSELDALENDLNAIREIADKKLDETLKALISLICMAREQSKPIDVVPD
ncbi:MAG: hypothetical protein ABJN98_06750 [Roseibium sp.]